MNAEFSAISKPGTKKGILSNLINQGYPGLVLLSSGTTGRPKAVLHNADVLLRKYLSARKRYITLALMLFDHIAGMGQIIKEEQIVMNC